MHKAMRHREHGVNQGQPAPRMTWTLLSWIWIAEEQGNVSMELARMGSGGSSQAHPLPPQMLPHCCLDVFSVPLQICSSLSSRLLWLWKSHTIWTLSLSSFVFRLQSGLANGRQPQELSGGSETPVFILNLPPWGAAADWLNTSTQGAGSSQPVFPTALSLPPHFSPLSLEVVTQPYQC